MTASPMTTQPNSAFRPINFFSRLAVGEEQTSNKVQPHIDKMAATIKQKPRALVVDDAPDVTEMLAIMLQYAGYEVVTVFSAPQALEAARRDHFDVLISDIGMPGMNGYELAEALRGTPDYQATPMIAVTGFTLYDDRDRALRSGFDAFLTKPINFKDLLKLIEQLRS
ncbi:MAG: response regulator [Pyrinomonadaceae bacterium]|jgi:CheY-like chemotaxis protein|nr:response regulator [Pyrinomonadaceae bacterium]MDQ3584238.1 response regulator [Acidobacteriota bacterium]